MSPDLRSLKNSYKTSRTSPFPQRGTGLPLVIASSFKSFFFFFFNTFYVMLVYSNSHPTVPYRLVVAKKALCAVPGSFKVGRPLPGEWGCSQWVSVPQLKFGFSYFTWFYSAGQKTRFPLKRLSPRCSLSCDKGTNEALFKELGLYTGRE